MLSCWRCCEKASDAAFGVARRPPESETKSPLRARRLGLNRKPLWKKTFCLTISSQFVSLFLGGQVTPQGLPLSCQPERNSESWRDSLAAWSLCQSLCLRIKHWLLTQLGGFELHFAKTGCKLIELQKLSSICLNMIMEKSLGFCSFSFFFFFFFGSKAKMNAQNSITCFGVASSVYSPRFACFFARLLAAAGDSCGGRCCQALSKWKQNSRQFGDFSDAAGVRPLSLCRVSLSSSGTPIFANLFQSSERGPVLLGLLQ